MGEEFFRCMMKAALLQQMQINHADSRKLGPGMFSGTNEHRWYLEHHPSIGTAFTDQDMLLIRINALDARDEELFVQLKDQLREVEVWSEK
ncbi:hypothetical protein MKY41_08415 [Sporosarcina sp. FSL W7-1349]|uniref:hypothetical protein n=1 Tax=Sporosarcina sp. FSL W7-1349 TaxID=2921561 RepID=UPI0030FC4685